MEWGFGMVGSNNSSGQSRFMSYLWANGIDCVKEDGGQWVSDLTADNENLKDGLLPAGQT